MNEKIDKDIKDVENEIVELTKEIKKYADSLDSKSLDYSYRPLSSFENKGIRLRVRLNELKNLKRQYGG